MSKDKTSPSGYVSECANDRRNGVSKIVVRQATEHNLKSVDIEIPRYSLTVVTGVSGSGKSSLVFDTLCREAERRYLESFSNYARQFLGKLARPAVGHIEGLSPAISIGQKTVIRNPRSTVGTMTELYDYLRLLFARLGSMDPTDLPDGTESTAPLQRRLFSFNSPYGACPACKGLGLQDRIDVDLLIADPSKTLREGTLKITTPSGYIIYSQVTMEVLDQVCGAHGFSVDIPWKDLTDQQKHVVLYGSDRIKIPYGKHPLESRLKWSGITAKPREEGYYKGILPVMENILRTSRNDNILRFARSVPCDACGGTRLRPEALAVRFRGKSIAELADLTIRRLNDFIAGLSFSATELAVGEPWRDEFLKRTALLEKLGLGYLTLERESTTLSGGEAQRIRLSTQVGSGLRGILYILDEPSIGLHHHDQQQLLNILHQLRDDGNTVIVVEHDDETIRNADGLIDIGPAAGVHGGEILYNGPLEDLFAPGSAERFPLLEKSRTYAFLTGAEETPIPSVRRTGTGELLQVLGAEEHNLKHIDVSFRMGAMNVVTGVSGSGKSTLVHDILASYLKKHINGVNAVPGKHCSVVGVENIDRIIEIDQAPIGRTPRSNPATYTKCFDHIRDLFASLPESRERKWSKGRFSFNVKGGRCESCEGAGSRQVGMHFLGNVDVLCDECGGKRFNDETLDVRYNGKNIYDILEMPIEEAVAFFAGHPKISRFLDTLQELGLGYMALGQSATTLSGGEAQRVKLASELAKPSGDRTLYILDEPTTGLHSADIKILLESLNRLVDKGSTVIVVEHHPDFIKTADWIVDLGPGSGDNGGELLVLGTPEEVTACERSHTGAFLRELLDYSGFRRAACCTRFASGGSPRARGRLPLDPLYPCGKNVYKQIEQGERLEPIRLMGVATHNLKNIDVTIPVNRLTVITGVSGSGKSSLAFDTLFAEGQMRYLTRFSTYARRLMVNSAGTDICLEESFGLTPTIAVNQSAAARNPRSTVGTMTEIYDYYRLLFARVGVAYCPDCGSALENGICSDCGFLGHSTLTAGMFSFNHHQGACPRCNGLGIITTCDPVKLVSHPERSMLGGALDGSKTGKFYGDPYGQYTAILRAVGESEGIDFSCPWESLDQQARRIAMFGTGETIYDVTWKYKRKNREGLHRFETAWKGFVEYVNEEYQRKHADKRGQSMLPLMTDLECPVCSGQRLKPEYLSVYFVGLNIAQLCNLTVKESIEFFNRLQKNEIEDSLKTGVHGFDRENIEKAPWSPTTAAITVELRREVVRRLVYLEDVGLGYLTLNRDASSLSGGEAQRIRLAGQLGGGLTGITYVLDEPTIGLHSRDTQRLLSVLKELRDQGNTIVVVEHDAEVIRAADHIIDMGPGSGAEGGRIVAEGTVRKLENNRESKTGFYLKHPDTLKAPGKLRTLQAGIKITGANANNLKQLDMEIPSGGIIAVTGVSGSGKSSLVFDVLAATAKNGNASGCETFEGLHRFDAVVMVDQKSIGSSPSSNPATYTGVFDEIRDVFAKTDYARSKGYKKNRFSFNVKGGRCENCQGMGRIRTSMDFLADVWTLCEECGGKRYNQETLHCLVKEKSIADVLEMTIREAVEFFCDRKKIAAGLKMMEDVGLGYCRLGQPANTLSGGESQRLKLVTQLIKGIDGKRNLYLFDEPTTGLHFEDIRRLLSLFHRLADAGHTLVVIEHNPDIIKNADYIIDLGPEGGDGGGLILAQGTPEEIRQNSRSFTGKIL